VPVSSAKPSPPDLSPLAISVTPLTPPSPILAEHAATPVGRLRAKRDNLHAGLRESAPELMEGLRRSDPELLAELSNR
jgi:hypothetical protein